MSAESVIKMEMQLVLTRVSGLASSRYDTDIACSYCTMGTLWQDLSHAPGAAGEDRLLDEEQR